MLYCNVEDNKNMSQYDPGRINAIKSYVTQYRGQFSMDAINESLLKSGYTKAETDYALVLGQTAQQVSTGKQPFSPYAVLGGFIMFDIPGMYLYQEGLKRVGYGKDRKFDLYYLGITAIFIVFIFMSLYWLALLAHTGNAIFFFIRYKKLLEGVVNVGTPTYQNK